MQTAASTSAAPMCLSTVTGSCYAWLKTVTYLDPGKSAAQFLDES